jgi:hypothetical protein
MPGEPSFLTALTTKKITLESRLEVSFIQVVFAMPTNPFRREVRTHLHSRPWQAFGLVPVKGFTVAQQSPESNRTSPH